MRKHGSALIHLPPLLLLLLVATRAGVDFESRPDLQAMSVTPPARAFGERAEVLLTDLLPGSDNATQRDRALRALARSKDRRFVAPLIDILRFADTREDLMSILQTLRALTGEKVDEWDDPWERLITWYGEHSELQPPPGYIGWKGELHAQLIDPRFRQFLYEGAPTAARVEEVVWGGVRVDGIPALVNPRMRPGLLADYLLESEPVFGVSINGDDRAYPLRILDWHEMANDTVGGKPVALAYCTLCGAGVLYDATAAGRIFEFGSSGFLFRSNKLMYDRQTKSLWNQLTGEPVIGKLVGSQIKLTVLPIVLTSWSEWRRQHPDTKVVDINTGHNRPYLVGAPYGHYFGSPGTMFPVWNRSQALASKARVFAIQVDGQAKAYPLDELNLEGGVVNDTIGPQRIVVSYRDGVGQVPLPETWQKALSQGDRAGATMKLANDLTLEAARAVLKSRPSLVLDLTADVLLAIPTEVRLTLLEERTSNDRQGSRAAEGMFTPDLRNEVAQRGLIGETRAYERGDHAFTPSPSKDELMDERARPWRVTEDALIGPDGQRLKRLGGHLAYWFGWFSFFPKTDIYTSQRHSRHDESSR